MFLLFVIMISGYLIISTIFNISVTADIHDYGLLKTIGTTNKQLKKIVIRQAVLMSCLSIPAGLGAGYLVSIIIFPLIAGTIIDIPDAVVFNRWFFIISGIFSWITVRISCIRPCRIVGKISPMEAIRYMDGSYTGKRKSKKAHRVTPAAMAWQNISRNRKRTFMVILSMALSVIMLNISVSVVSSFDEELYLSEFMTSDYTIADATVFNRQILAADYEGVSRADMEYCENMNGIEDIGAVYMTAGTHQIEGTVLKRVQMFYDKWQDQFHPAETEGLKTDIFDRHIIYCNIYGIDQLIYDNLETDAGKIDRKKFSTGNYAVVSAPIEGTDHDASETFYEIGETIHVELPDGIIKSYEVMGIGALPYAMGPGYSYTVGIDVFIPSDEYLSHSRSEGAMKLCFNVDDAHMDEVEAMLTEYCEKKNPLLDFESRNKYKEDFRKMKGLFLMMGSAMSLILALIGTLNFINLTYTSINERRNELSTLHAVGMTYKQINDMLIAESVIRIMLTFGIVFTIGIGLNRFIVNMIAGRMIMFQYRFVVWPMIVCVPLYLLMALLVSQKMRWHSEK